MKVKHIMKRTQLIANLPAAPGVSLSDPHGLEFIPARFPGDFEKWSLISIR
jgi:hypothetical protein